MIIIIGHCAVALALLLSFAQAFVPLIGALRHYRPAMQAGRVLAIINFVLISLGFFALMHAHVTDDFSILNVAMNSHSTKPLLYKITGTWASHEGSLMLWVLILTLFGALMSFVSPDMPLILRARALAVQGMTGLGFIAFILFTSDPFLRVFPAPADGNDLNPLLQDPGLAFHPPGLYLGYVGFSSVFSLAAALLMTDGIDARWAKWLRPWILGSWACLTMGITGGSWWAYYELGWGGWWFWDPVENAALMPWLAGTALLHSAATSVQRGALLQWTLLLSIVTFSLSLLGTFLVRSGILTSVHTFAVDPERGVFVLALLGIATGGALVLYAARAHRLPQSPLFKPISREGALLINNLFVCTACATLVTGTLYPIILDAIGGGTVSVGAPYFNATIVPLMLPVFFIMAFAPFLRWKQGDLRIALSAMKIAAVLSFASVLTTLYIYGFKHIMGVTALALGAWLVGGTLTDAWRSRAHLFTHLPRLLGHAGIGIAIIGMAGSVYNQEYAFTLEQGQSKDIAGYHIVFVALNEIAGANYEAQRGTFTVSKDRDSITLFPEWRFYPIQGMPLSHVALRPDIFRDLYLALGQEQDEDRGKHTHTVRFQIHPLAPWIWIGGLIIAMGGFAGVAGTLIRKRRVKEIL
jgi:cytochrome c-type biogenesis protein CcmF